MSTKKILFVASRQFWPTTGGKDVSLFFDCKGLHEEYGYDIYLFCFADKSAQKNIEKPDFIKELTYAEVPGIKKGLLNIFKNFFFFKGWPFQNSLYYSRDISRELVTYCNIVQPDVVIIDMVRLVPYYDDLLKTSNKTWKKEILIEDDLLAKRYRRQLAASMSGNMTGQYSKNLPLVMNRILNLQFVKKLVLYLEARRLEKYERQCVDKFDYIAFASPIETIQFNEMYNTTKGITLTMGADVKYYAEGSIEKYLDNSMSIVANFNTAANADSIEFICTEIIPKLPNNTKYYVIGKCPDEIRQKYEGEKVCFLGFVDDIRSVVKATSVYLSPLAYGTGIKTKIVEALAMGMAVVTNSVGAEGLAVQNGRELFIAEDPKEIVRITKKLLEDPQLRRKIGSRGQRFAETYHDWNTIYKSFEAMGL